MLRLPSSTCKIQNIIFITIIIIIVLLLLLLLCTCRRGGGNHYHDHHLRECPCSASQRCFGGGVNSLPRRPALRHAAADEHNAAAAAAQQQATHQRPGYHQQSSNVDLHAFNGDFHYRMRKPCALTARLSLTSVHLARASNASCAASARRFARPTTSHTAAMSGE